MNEGFQDFAAENFENGLSKLNQNSRWNDDRTDLDGPFQLNFPEAKGWGEELLVASLLKRHANASKTKVPVFASEQVCSILKHDRAFLPRLRDRDKSGRPPLAIIRHALTGSLLDDSFVPLALTETMGTAEIHCRPRIGIAWASVSGNRPIPEKSVPVAQFLTTLAGIDAELISLQREPSVADPQGLAREHGVHLIEKDILDAKTPSNVEGLVETIRGLDLLVTISTTTTHIAAALGIRVELIVAERWGQQWFWQVQAKHGRRIYPSVGVHLGDGRKQDWWERPLQSLHDSLPRKDLRLPSC